ncbi:MAG: hypothetical protein ACRD0U_04965 [Acidimicrobiales bacterium]
MSDVPPFIDRLGERAVRRMQPRLTIALAGVGVGMIIVGILSWAGERVGGSGEGGGGGKALGALLSLAVAAAGYTMLTRFQRGPLVTAGVVASALAVPVMLGFITFDRDGPSELGFALPINVNAVAVVSIAAWMVTYLLVPGGRGHLFYLGASLFTLWLFVTEQVEQGAFPYLLTVPFFVLVPIGLLAEEQGPDPSTIGAMALLFGAAYYTGAFVLDRWQRPGLATPFYVAGFVATVVGIAHVGSDLQLAGTGILLIAAGAVVATFAVTQGRRFTTWAWAAGAGLGVLLIPADIFDDNAAGFGFTAILLGAAVVFAAHRLAETFDEPDETLPVASRFRRAVEP